MIKEKVFLSQPMAGIDDKDIKSLRNSIKKFLEGNGYELIDSYLKDDSKSPIEMLGKSIELMSDADYVYFANNWELSRGCQIEHQVAKAYNKYCVTDLEFFINRR